MPDMRRLMGLLDGEMGRQTDDPETEKTGLDRQTDGQMNQLIRCK